MSRIDTIEPMIRELPPELQQEALAYIRKLVKKSKTVAGRKLSFEWAGGLSGMKGAGSSVEVQHQITKWWI